MFRGPSRPRAHEQVLKLHDGRLLGYTEYGDPEGSAVFYFHGWPGSRLDAGPWDAAAQAEHVRLIALDRPGFGLSDFQPARSIAGWPADVSEAADLLGPDHFAVVGYSGGGPYALACGAAPDARLSRIAVVSSLAEITAAGQLDGMSGTNRGLFILARRYPWALPIPLGVVSFGARHFPGLASRGVAAPERAIFKSIPGLEQALVHSVQEAFRHGVRGAADEGVLFMRPWGFLLEQVRLPVSLWQGEADTNVPPAMGHRLAEGLPHCTAHFIPGAGHLWGVANGVEVLHALVAN